MPRHPLVRRRVRRPLISVGIYLAGAMGLASGSSALGADPGRAGRVVLGAAPAYAYLVLEGRVEPAGGGGSIFLRYGVTEAIAVGVTGQWTAHAIDSAEGKPGGTYQVLGAAATLSYALDWASFSPAVEFGVGVMRRRFRDTSATDATLRVGLSGDYWFRPWLAVGAAIHYHAFVTDLGQFPAYVDLGPRVALRWP